MKNVDFTNNEYELLRQVSGSVGDRPIKIGQPYKCRYCGRQGYSHFRKIAHTFPESLGNKWVFSLDECDKCNATFSIYEDALSRAMSPLLTLGGVRGKHNHVRQTGRTKGPAALAHYDGEERRHLSLVAQTADFSKCLQVDPVLQRVRFTTPIADVQFIPRNAYKALCKMAFSLLPEDEVGNYEKLRTWLFKNNDNVDFCRLEVAASFGSIGNAPKLVSGTLLRRRDSLQPMPHILFIFCAGSLCLQIDLMSDHLEDNIPLMPPNFINLRYSNILNPPGRTPLKIDYGTPIHFNWAGTTPESQPVQAVIVDVDLATSDGQFKLILRQEA